MATPAQYLVDFTSADALTAVLNDYFAVGVIPVVSDNTPKVMNPVKLQVMLPLERELFFTGIVIMHRPGGFLVQCDTPPNMQFLHDTIRDDALAHAREIAHNRETDGRATPLKDEIFDEVPVEMPRTSPRTERMGALSTPDTDEVPAAPPTRDRGRGQQPPVQAMRGFTDSEPIEDEPERPATGKSEKTRPGIRKTSQVRAPAPAAVHPPAVDDDDEFSISSISAVDAVTGQAKPIRPKTGQHKPAPFETKQFGRDQDDDDIPVFVETAPPRQTTRQEFPDVTRKPADDDPNRTIRMKPVGKTRPAVTSPLDELFEMASTAGAPGISSEQFASQHSDQASDGLENIKTHKMRPVEFQDELDSADGTDASSPADGDQDVFDDDSSGPLDRELAVSIREMTTPEKQRLARQGKRVARRILIRDNDKTIHKFVFFNPDLKLDEVVEYTRANSLAADAIEFICTNRQWMESHDVILNIVRNTSTPIELAVRLVIKLTQADWRMLARPGLVRPPIANQARRLLQGVESM